MIFRGACLAIIFFFSIVLVPAQEAQAGRGGRAVGVGIGIVGAAILLNQAAKHAKRNRRGRVRRGNRGKVWRSGRTRYSYTRLQVAQIQRMLNRLGFSAGELDGHYGNDTRVAVKRFQRAIGRRATGRLSGNELTALIRRTKRAMARSAARRTVASSAGAVSGVGSVSSLQPTSASPPEGFASSGVGSSSAGSGFTLPTRYVIQSKWVLRGNVGKRQGVQTANACAAICDKSSCCQGFVYRGGQCTILKNVTAMGPNTQSNLNFVSGIKRESSSGNCRI